MYIAHILLPESITPLVLWIHHGRCFLLERLHLLHELIAGSENRAFCPIGTTLSVGVLDNVGSTH